MTISPVLKSYQELKSFYQSGQNLDQKFFKDQNRQHLIKLLEELGTVIFTWTIEKNKKVVVEFKPALLSAYIVKVHNVLTMRDNGEIFFYDRKREIYVSAGKEDLLIHEIIKTIYREEYTKRMAIHTIDNIKASTVFGRENFILDPHYIPVLNCIIKIVSTPYGAGKLRWNAKIIRNNPRYFVTNRLPINYLPDQKCEKIMSFLKQVLSSDEDIKFLQEYLGYALYREALYDIVVMFLGEGDNGKSTLIELITKFLGPDNCVAVSIQDLCNDRWSKAELYHKLANLDADIASNELRNTSSFKRVTGGDRIKGERKGQDPFYFFPYAVHIWSANRMPFCYDWTNAFFRRWRILEFKRKFPRGSAIRDPDILSKLLKELPGLLNWALFGLIRILTNKGFSDLPTVDEVRQHWLQLSDPIYAFVESGFAIIDPKAAYIKSEFASDFRRYCITRGIPPWSAKEVGVRLSMNYPQITTGQRRISGKQIETYKGIRKVPVIKNSPTLIRGNDES